MHKSENDLCHLPRAPVVFVRFELGIMRERVLHQEKIHTYPLRGCGIHFFICKWHS